jgi:ferredoxin-NADP reductase
MVTRSYTVGCIRNRLIARDTWEFLLEKPAGFSFQPGQFLLFKVPLVEDPSDVQPRAFSIASAPGEDGLLFVAKMKRGGRASRWIAELLKEGTKVTMQGPFGNFLLQQSDHPILLIAASTGVAPFRSMLVQQRAESEKRKVDLIFGMRGEEDIFWIDELAKHIPREQIHVTLSQPSDAWTGHRGRVQSLLPSAVPDLAQRSVYVCGNPDMTKELKQLCLDMWGVAKERLHVEGYI